MVLHKRGGQKTGGRNAYFANNEDAFKFIRETNAKGEDVWFALALFGELEKRTQTNATSAKSFWLDIDVGSEKPYANISEAAEALGAFCNRLALPIPTVVGSGTGLHVHWIVDQRIDRERWEKTAKALKNACTRQGLKAGPERTADIASVLRIPGTKHLKDPTDPKDVKLLGPLQGPVAVSVFEHALSPYIVLDNKRVANKVFEANLPQLPYDAEKIATGCGVIGRMRETRGRVAEPVWYGALQVLHHCIDGEEIAHKWSEGYEGYSYQATEEKYARAKEFGPTLCTRFAEYEPDTCKVCPSFGRISTPLQLGAVLTPVVLERNLPATTSAADGFAGVPQPEHTNGRDSSSVGEWKPSYTTPNGYEVGNEGVYYYDTEAEKRIPVLDVPLWVSQLTDSVHEADMQATIEWKTRSGKHRTSVLRIDSLMELREFGKWLASRGITGFAPRNLEQVRNYVWACVQVYQHNNEAETVYEHFGWHRNGFVVGTNLVSPGSVAEVTLANRVPSKMHKYLVEKGDVDSWAKATESIRQSNYLPHQFTLVAALGSILFSLMGVQGAVLSLAGDSGVGKTTIGLFGLSAFGDPKALEISPQSTERAFHELWYVPSNLPVLINEAATLDLFKLSSLIYAAANGQARSTLTRNSELRESDGWQLLSIFTSNSHLLSLDEKWLNEANRRRILELTLTKPDHEMSRETALILHRTMQDHYGCVGRLFIRYCVDHREEVRDLLRSIYEAYAKGDIPAEHRFNQWTIAVAQVAGMIGEKLGIIRFDTKASCQYAAEIIRESARTVQSSEQRTDDILADYINEFQGQFTRFTVSFGVWSEIRGAIAGKYYQDKEKVWTLSVPASKFKEFARERGIDTQHIGRWMAANKVTSAPVRLAPLAKTVRCFVIPIAGEVEDAS